MRLARVLMVTGCGMALAAAPLLAQGRPLPLQKPPTRAQTGTAGQAAAPRAAERAPSERGRRADRGGAYYGGSSGYRYVPVMVGQDGNVYANFGYGYERVLRQCTLAQTVQQPRVQQPTPQAYSQPALTQPVPRPQTASPAIGATPSLSGLTSGNTKAMHVGPATQLAAAACWSQLGNGNVTVRR